MYFYRFEKNIHILYIIFIDQMNNIKINKKIKNNLKDLIIYQTTINKFPKIN